MCSKEVPLCIVQFPLAIENLKQLICNAIHGIREQGNIGREKKTLS